MPQLPIVWNRCRAKYSVKHGPIVLPADANCAPGTDYTVHVETFCGTDKATMDVSPQEFQPASQLARRCEIVASIQHVAQRGCDKCRQQFFNGVSAAEKKWLYSEDPTLGPIIGVDGGELLLP